MNHHALIRVACVALASARGLAAAQAAPESSPLPRGADGEREPEPDRAASPAAPAPFSFAEPTVEGADPIAANGYVLAQFEVVELPSALPVDRRQYGARGTRAGFALHGAPFESWSYMAHVIVGPPNAEQVALLGPTHERAQSALAGVAIAIEEVSLSYRPASWFAVRAGVLRIPFSLAQTTMAPKQMFPTRPVPTGIFQKGADQGITNTISVFEGRLRAVAGAYFGSSLPAPNPAQAARGLAFAAAIEAHPLGVMPRREGDTAHAPLRVAVGVSALHRAATSFDAGGYEATKFTQTNVGAAFRASWANAYVQAELLRRVTTDALTSRSSVAEGGYAQASYYVPFAGVGVAPLVRFGRLSNEQDSVLRRYASFEGGVAFYPRSDVVDPERLRIVVQYLGLSASPSNEVQHEGIVQLQLEW